MKALQCFRAALVADNHLPLNVYTQGRAMLTFQPPRTCARSGIAVASRPNVCCKAAHRLGAHKSHPAKVSETTSPLQPLLQTASISMAALAVLAGSLSCSPAEALEIVPPGPPGVGRSAQALGVPCTGSVDACVEYQILLKQLVVNRVAKDTAFGGDAEWRLHGTFGNKDIGDFNYDLEGNTDKRQVRDLGYNIYVTAKELPLDLVIQGYEEDDTSSNDLLPTLREPFNKRIASGTYTLSAPGNGEGQYDIIVEVTRRDLSNL